MISLMNGYNEKGQKHGYWEHYWINEKLHSKGHYINGKLNGYWEYPNFSGNLIEKEFYL
jgi:antitoxin component YwqK of YwqJK toxin-antitoxin module